MSGHPHDLDEFMDLWCESSPEEEIELRRIIDQQYRVARKIIEDNRAKVEKMAKTLLE